MAPKEYYNLYYISSPSNVVCPLLAASRLGPDHETGRVAKPHHRSLLEVESKADPDMSFTAQRVFHRLYLKFHYILMVSALYPPN